MTDQVRKPSEIRLSDEDRRTARLVRNGYWIDRLLEAYDSALDALDAARKALWEYGHHKPGCSALFGTFDRRNPCDCGLAALAAASTGGIQESDARHE